MAGGLARGPQPKPTELKVLRGNPGKRPLNPHELKPRLGVPDPPAELDLRAKTEYHRIVDELSRAAPRLLTQLDDTELSIFCESKIHWLDGVAEINAIKRKRKPVDRMLVVTLSKWALQMHQAGDRIGLSPAARARLSLALGPAADDDDDF